MGRCGWFDCCKGDVELGLSRSERPDGNDNEGFGQEWFDEDCDFSDLGQEAEELQIEHEIQELEEAEEEPQCFCLRGVPKKPPPPYASPDQSTRNPTASISGVSRALLRNQDLTKELPIIFSTAEELTSVTLKMTGFLYNLFIFSGDIQHAEVPPEFNEDDNTADMRVIEKSSRRMFKKLIFDLTKDLIKTYYGSMRENPCVPWDWPAFSSKRKKLPQRSKEMLQEVILKKVLDLFGFAPKVYKEKLVIRWSRKKRDYVDEILMKESHDEESAWTDYAEDEVTVKNEIALGLLDSLLDETVKIILDIRKAKLKK
ncbi:Centrosome-associated protein 350 [Zootermopsis nevadensis]|uniref:Centrosome-associated protein 350 n=2 Tax=Zootermopsis nevadensis TaxID=136037 RepID=A0A067QTS9_ZOONE|nr:Centrosome-associated protein 350 [Zootermopsis nevadensis]